MARFCCFSQQFFTLFCFWEIIIPFSNQKKGKLSITIENEYIPLVISRLAFALVVKWMKALTFSSNWFWGSGFKSPCSKFFVTIFFLFLESLFCSLFFTCVVHIATTVNWKQSWQEISLVVCRLLLSCCFLFSKSNLYLSLYVHFINRLVLRVRISWNSWFYFLFYMICISLDMISISQRAIHFHPSISIKANGINSHYSE